MTEVKMVRCPDCGGPIDACECEPRLTGREVFQKWQPSDSSLFAQNPDRPSMFREDDDDGPTAAGIEANWLHATMRTRLTRPFAETVAARWAVDPEFRQACRDEGLSAPDIPVTPEMIEAGKAAWIASGGELDTILACYRAMAALAPNPPPFVWTKDPANGLMTPHYPERERIAALEAENAAFRKNEDDTNREVANLQSDIEEGSLRRCAVEAEQVELIAQNQQWQDTWAATEHHRQEAMAQIEERDREIVQLRAERAAWKHLFEVASGEQSDARMLRADEAHPYHGPTRPVTDADGNVTGRESIPDPVHERVHEVIGDVLAGKVMRPAREQMEKALTDARAKDGKAAPFPVTSKSTDHRRIGL